MRDREEKPGCCPHRQSFWQNPTMRGVISAGTVFGATAVGVVAGELATEYCPYLRAYGRVVNIMVGAAIGLGASAIPIVIANIMTSCKQREYEHVYASAYEVSPLDEASSLVTRA